MVQLFGRITADAKVSKVREDKEVINFTIAINDSYKSKDGTIKKTVFVRCSYWFNSGMAAHLTKGRLIEVNGRLEVSAYINMQVEPVGRLDFHVSNFKFLGNSEKKSTEKIPAENKPAVDLPF